VQTMVGYLYDELLHCTGDIFPSDLSAISQYNYRQTYVTTSTPCYTKSLPPNIARQIAIVKRNTIKFG